MRLVTERLIVRKFHPGDAEAFRGYRSDPEVARYQSWTTPLSLEAAVATVAEYGAADPDEVGWFQYAIEAGGTLIGDIGVNIHDNRMQADIGFTLAAEHQGQGYATEAVRRVVEHLFTDRGLHRISAECDARNDSSARLLSRLGFQREGLSRSNTWINGEWTDDLLFGLLSTDYATASAADE